MKPSTTQEMVAVLEEVAEFLDGSDGAEIATARAILTRATGGAK